MTDNAKIKVLVMDRDPRVRAAVGEILRREPDLVLVGEAEPDGHLVRLTPDCMPHVIVCGSSLGGPSPLETVREISQRAPGARLLISASHIDGRYADRVLDAGACGLLLKDHAAEALPESIRAVAAGQIYISPAVERVGRRTRAGIGSRQRRAFPSGRAVAVTARGV